MTEIRMNGINACVFDAYGTLFDVQSAVGRHREQIGQKADAVSALWRQKQLEYTWLRSLIRCHADFWQITGDALDFALAVNAIDDEGLKHDLMQAYLSLDAYQEVPPTLATLSDQGFKLAILSNGSPAMLAAAVENAGLGARFDDVLSVETCGIFKPDPAVYQMACDTFGLSAVEICFLSSNGWDVAGAASFGYQVVWINRFNQPSERLPGRPQAEIGSLDQLLPLLMDTTPP